MNREEMVRLIKEHDERLKNLYWEIEEAISYLAHPDANAHKIINWALGQLSSEFGNLEANRAIIDFDLDKLGWAVRNL